MVTLSAALKSLKHTPVSISDLQALVPTKCKVVKLQALKETHRTVLFKNLRALVVLLPSTVSKIGHYICLMPRRNHIEYFSSLGNSPSKEATLLHNDEGTMKTLLGAHFIYNRTPLQDRADFKITTCAMFVVARAFLSDLKLREFVSLFSKPIAANTPDDIVAFMNFLRFQDV